jgi:hypothetical protein
MSPRNRQGRERLKENIIMTEIKPLGWEPGPEFNGCTWRLAGHYPMKVVEDDTNGTHSFRRVEIWEAKHPDRHPALIHKYLT